MIHSNNPLAHGDIDEEPADVQLYANNVVVESIPLDNKDI